MNVIRKKNEPPFFIARTYQYGFFIARTCLCFYCANSTKKKLPLFTARTGKMFSRHEPRKKKIFLLHELVCCYCANSTKKNCFFLLHELVCGLIEWTQKKTKNFYCTNSITISFEISCSYCANSNFFSKCTNCIKSSSEIHTEHISYKHQKKRNLFDCANSQNKIVFTARTK
jgi:hypothetical protein